ncbi:kin of IRRE-like protein 3 [Lycorma delicatula]|uniref:kin of IRRE-like protein 3 n=1 Tax=Lycorma delicatula TaxID=130591 RepID=UPI003F51040C
MRWLSMVEIEIGVSSLKLTTLHIEKHTVRGNDSLLECRFDLEGESLYSVKWYKDGHEFFRYIPRDYPSIQIFPVPGVNIDMKHSNESQVLLTGLKLQSSGRYRCEVSAEAPSFQTVSEHGDMVTVALPTEGPVITGGRPRYQVGDWVHVNCTSGSSKPPAHLTWFINGDQVNSSFLRGPYKVASEEEGLERAILGLEFQVEQRHFKNGDLKLKCLATIATIYWNSNEESVEGEKPQRAPVLEVKDTGHNSRADRVQASTGAGETIIPSSGLLTIIFIKFISPFLIETR